MPLTRKQHRLRAEIKEIAAAINMDHWNIETHYKRKSRSLALEFMKDELVRGEVISCYTFIDELLTNIICNFYFGRRAKKFDFAPLWKTKRFKIFAQYIMDETSLLRKRAIVHAIRPIPKDVWNAIERMNAVRNAIAHSFFPQNRRRYAADKKVMYRAVHLFSLHGVEKFAEDFKNTRVYLAHRC
jgi:hypothetical protein